MNSIRLLSIFYGIVLLLFSCKTKSLHFISNGASSFEILIPTDADSTITFAAQDLQTILKESFGVTLPIQVDASSGKKLIKIGFKQEKIEDPNLVAYEVTDQEVSIRGGSSKSILHGVYEFLERELGIRFYAPGEISAPDKSDVWLKFGSYNYTPTITTRTVHSRLFYENPVHASRLKVTKESFPGYVPEARVHTFHLFMPADQYYTTHPEYYALRNGRRITTQLCLSNPDVLKIVKQEVANSFEKNPNHPIISVSQDDNTQYCQCVNCMAIDDKEESPAGSMVAFVNEIAKTFPEKTISTLAYQYTRKAPKHIKPEKNVLITLCSIECDRSKPISVACKDFTKDLEDWGRITDQVRIWDYTTQFTNFLAPFPNLYTLQPNIQLFESNNAKWIFEQHSNQPSELFELRSYITAKLLWDPTLNIDSLLEDFTSGYYEDAGPFVLDYIKDIHQNLALDSTFFLFLYGDPSQGFKTFLSSDNLTKYNKWFDRAEAIVKDNPKLLDRVEAARLSIDFATLEARRKGLSESLNLKSPDEVIDQLDKFQRVTQKQNITMLNEMRYTVDEYLEAYRDLLKRSSQVNIALGKKVTLLTKPKKYANEDPQALTDGAFGGSSFHANWLGYEGNSLEAVIDFENQIEITGINTALLQVVNHIVFFPLEVSFYISNDGTQYKKIKAVKNPRPLNTDSKINDIWNIALDGINANGRYLKIEAKNRNAAPDWHHGAGLPSWIFMDEVGVE